MLYLEALGHLGTQKIKILVSHSQTFLLQRKKAWGLFHEGILRVLVSESQESTALGRRNSKRDYSGGPEVKNLPSDAGDRECDPWWGN